MLNFVFSPNVLLGFILGSSVIILYFLRLVKPEVARDEDIFFATIGLLYSGILVIHGWRLDPILLFSQVLVITAVLAAGWENIRLRGVLAMLALRDIEENKKTILIEKVKLEKELLDLDLVDRVYPSDANFFLVEVKDANSVYQSLVDQKIVVRNRNQIVRNCIRITVGSPAENQQLINALKTIEL